MFQKKQVHGRVKVRVIEGKDLPKKDFGPFGKSDPYCIVKLGGQSFKTKIVKNNLNPYWGEEFTLNVYNPTNDMIMVELKDWDLGPNPDDYMGHVQFPVCNLIRGQELDLWLGLSGSKKGQIHLAITALDFGKQNPQQQQQQQQQQYAPPPQYYAPQGPPPHVQGYIPVPPPQQSYGGYPPPQQQPYAPAPYPQAPPPQGYPPQGYPPQYPQQPGYPPQQPGYPPQQPGYPPQQPGYPPQQPGYPPQQGYPPRPY